MGLQLHSEVTEIIYTERNYKSVTNKDQDQLHSVFLLLGH